MAGRSWIRPVTQIKTVDTFDDQKAAGSTMETTTWNMEQFLGGVISQLNRFLNTSVSGNDWFADLTAPTTFENGAQRGIDETNQDLHDLERKRILRWVQNLTDITVPSAVQATGTLTSTGTPSNNDQVQIGGQTYTYKTTLTGAADEVLIGASQATSMENLRRAINDDGVAGVNYGTGTVANAYVTATDTATTVVATAIKYGTAGNTVSTTDPVDVGGVLNWSGATLSGGAGDMVILGTGELPSQTTAAVGAVTTLGTVVAYNSSFGTATLDEVAGSSAVNPKNMMQIVDADTHDPILANGKQIWALFQSESNTDGHTITDTTPTRVQLTFVVLTDEADDLEIVDGQYIGGDDINYTYTERKALQDLNEQDFLRGAAIDIGGGAVTPTRQNAYDNQGTTPVDLTNNAYLDLESSGLVWQIRDDAEAVLFGITEGSSGSNSTVQIGADTDNFDVDAVDNDFLNGASFDTGAAGTTINIGTTANQIDSGGALTVTSGGSGDLDLVSVAQLVVTDQWQSGSGYTTDLVLSDSSTEWDDYETAFGEVSLLNAIVQASENDNRHRAVSEVTSNIAADTLVEGPNGPGSANTSADLLDYRNVTFVDDVEIFVNGQLMRNGADAAANNDVYPSATATPDQQYGCFYAEFPLLASPGNADVIQMFITGALT